MKIMTDASEQDITTYNRDPDQNTFAQFLVNKGLYERYEIDKTNIQDVIDVLNGHVRINIFCKDCGETRVFSMNEILFPYKISDADQEMKSLGKELLNNQWSQEICTTPRPNGQSVERDWYWTNWQTQKYTRVMVFQYMCAFNKNHFTDFVVRAVGNTLLKIGQYPSIADMTFPELDYYKHVISNQDRKELGTAIGLFANGVGAGSYVYLRRILERLVHQAKEKAGDSIDNEEFEKARVADKIKMLQGFVPDILMQNVTIYGVLSKGIHELSEEECLAYFPIVKECIFQILGMWEDTRKRQVDKAALNKALNTITYTMKLGGSGMTDVDLQKNSQKFE